MEQLKYKVIKSKLQYQKYCNLLEELIIANDSNKQDEIELLTVLIEKWDEESNSFNDLDPIEILKSLMSEHNLIAKDLVNILQVSKGTISKILNYQKGISKESIRKLSEYFKVSQEAFNRPYLLKQQLKRSEGRSKKIDE